MKDFSMFQTLTYKFYYKTKQPTPPLPVFAKVFEIKQKNHIFQCFAPWFSPPDFSTLLCHCFSRNITCSLKVTI